MRGKFKSWLAAALLAPIVLVFVKLYSIGEIEKSRDFQKKSSKIVYELSQLYADLGYGGMIHAFKNAVLRPDEPQYAMQVIESGRSALARAYEIERLAKELHLRIELSQMRTVLSTYRSKLASFSRWKGLSAREVDRRVRIDDAPALVEIGAAQRAVNEAARQATATLEHNLQLVWMIGLAFAGSLSGVAIFLLNQERQRADAAFEKEAKLTKELESANALLEKASAAINDFAAIAAHDLRGSLVRISLLSSIASEKVEQGSVDTATLVGRYLTNIKNNALSCQEILSGLAEFSREGRRKLCLARVDMRDLLEQMARRMTDGHEQGHRITVRSAPDVLADSVMVTLVFQNLFENSFRYGRAGAPAHVEVSGHVCEDGSVLYTVQDNGPGIPKGMERKIFAPLVRGAEHKDRKDGGIGLGLSTVKMIVEIHGGSIWVDQDFEDGARFCFTLSAPSLDPCEQAIEIEDVEPSVAARARGAMLARSLNATIAP